MLSGSTVCEEGIKEKLEKENIEHAKNRQIKK